MLRKNSGLQDSYTDLLLLTKALTVDGEPYSLFRLVQLMIQKRFGVWKEVFEM